ncbi:MAG: hypothetical protein ACI3V0_05440 [Faecousia sp.]
MAERANPLRKIQFVIRPGPRKLKILFLALILACTAALIALSLVRSRIQQQTQAALDQAAVLEQENAELSQKDDELDASDIRQIAKEELGLVDPDTIIIDPNS